MPFPETIDRTSSCWRPAEPAIGYHVWSNLLFVHWRVSPEVLEPLIPSGLKLDTFDGWAWVGLVPFYMSRVRPWWSPPVPGVSWFCETNVRTYVHCRGCDPGVWFFSLEASSSIAVRVARARWHLPYHRARMTLERRGESIRYASRRLWPGSEGAGCAISATLLSGKSGRPPVTPSVIDGRAVPGTLEHFLVERYILYAHARNGAVLSGRVHHRPYTIEAVRLDQCDETLLAAAGIHAGGPPDHVAYCNRVEVDIFPLRPGMTESRNQNARPADVAGPVSQIS